MNLFSGVVGNLWVMAQQTGFLAGDPSRSFIVWSAVGSPRRGRGAFLKADSYDWLPWRSVWGDL